MFATTDVMAQIGPSATITINPTPTVTKPADAAFCNNDVVAATTLTGTPSGVTYNISGGASIGLANATAVTQIPSFTATNNTTAPVTATITITPNANGCTGSAVTFDITVNPTPDGSIVSVTTPICQGATAELKFTATSGTGPFDLDIRENGGASTTYTGKTSGTAFSVTPGAASGTFTYDLMKIKDAKGCIKQ